jgi:hypothetical protein
LPSSAIKKALRDWKAFKYSVTNKTIANLPIWNVSSASSVSLNYTLSFKNNSNEDFHQKKCFFPHGGAAAK